MVFFYIFGYSLSLWKYLLSKYVKCILGGSLNKINQFLFDWTFHFIKNKDIVLRKIVNIEEYINQNYVFVEYKDKKMVYLVVPFVDDFDKVWGELQEFKKKTESDASCIVMFNNKENLDKVVEKWDVIDKDPKFQLIFSNPFSVTDKRWIIFPYTHSRITEASALKSGLKSLFNVVDPISEKTVERMISQ